MERPTVTQEDGKGWGVMSGREGKGCHFQHRKANTSDSAVTALICGLAKDGLGRSSESASTPRLVLPRHTIFLEPFS